MNQNMLKKYLEIEDVKQFVSETIGTCHDSITVQSLAGGLTRNVWLLRGGDRDLVVRIPSPSSSDLGIDFQREAWYAAAAAASNLAPPIVFSDPLTGFMIIEYVNGLTLDLVNFSKIPETVDKVIKLLFDFHSLKKITEENFSPLSLFNHFYQSISNHKSILQDFDYYIPKVKKIINLMSNYNSYSCPCHNDAFPKNIIQANDGTLSLIDFEFSGNADPAIDIATLWNEGNFEVSDIEMLAKKYCKFSNDDPLLFCSKVWLFSLIIDVVWAMYMIIKSRENSNTILFLKLARTKWFRATQRIELRITKNYLDKF